MEKIVDLINVNDKKVYLPPIIEAVEVAVEKGFAVSDSTVPEGEW